MVEFNVESGFVSSLSDLGDVALNEVFDVLEGIESSNLSWDHFVEMYGWVQVKLTGQETYPGADPLHWFAIVGRSGVEYQIAAKGPYGAVVICSVAVLRR